MRFITSASDATVTVNSQATYRRGEYFHKEISVSNGSNPVWQSLSIQAVDGASSNTDTGNQFVPKTPEIYDHDADGNLLYDGRWDYTWDAENRLIRMIARTLTGPQQRIDFEYDASGRRIRKKVWNNTTGSGTPASDVKFLYDGWNLIAELNGLSANAVLRSYVWGNDLSGSSQGAGGVGGLLAVKSSGVCHFAAYDGNGNVLGVVNGSNGTISAQYEYGPFGEMIRITGSLAQSNPFRFSTKYQDDQTGFLYYGYRYYDSSTGRWLNRDPINETGGANLNLFVRNGPNRFYDYLGLEGCDLSYSFDQDEAWWEKTAYPRGTKWVEFLEEAKKDIKQKLKDCCCIQRIYFTQHNGVPGILQLGEGSLPINIIERIKAETDAEKRDIYQKAIEKEQQFLSFVKKFTCKGGKIIFVQCESGAGPEGEELKEWLQNFMGQNIEVTLYDTGVRWFYGRPKACKSKEQ